TARPTSRTAESPSSTGSVRPLSCPGGGSAFAIRTIAAIRASVLSATHSRRCNGRTCDNAGGCEPSPWRSRSPRAAGSPPRLGTAALFEDIDGRALRDSLHRDRERAGQTLRRFERHPLGLVVALRPQDAARHVIGRGQLDRGVG